MSYAKDRAEFLVVAGRAGLTEPQCAAIIRHAKAIEISNLLQCNEPLTEDEMVRLELSDAEHLEQIVKTLYGSGVRISRGGDPRGFAVRLHFPDATWNTWGGKEHGFGVPTPPTVGDSSRIPRP